MLNTWLLYWNLSPKGAVRGSVAAEAISSSGVSSKALKPSSASRVSTPMQAQKRSATVMRRVSSGSARTKSGRSSTTGVSQPMRPSSTSAAVIVVVSGLVAEATRIRVSGLTGLAPPSSLTPKPARVTTSPPWTTATEAPGTRIIARVVAT
jgi:hypothetical protein